MAELGESAGGDAPGSGPRAAPADSQATAEARTRGPNIELDRLRSTDRLAILGSIAASLAHELGTPLNVIEGRAAMMESGGISEAEFLRHARIIAEQSAKMTRVISELLGVAREAVPTRQSFDVGGLLLRVARFVRRRARRSGVRLELEIAADAAEVSADPHGVFLALLHLIDNGIEAMPRGGRLTVRLENQARRPFDDPSAPERSYLLIRVRDEGDGVADAVRSRLFRPFRSTKHPARGLGLAVAQRIARAHGGCVSFDPAWSRGACFTLSLPQRSSG